MKTHNKRIMSAFLFLILLLSIFTASITSEEVICVDDILLCTADDGDAENAAKDSFFCTDECDDECVSYHWYIGPETSKRFYNKNTRENSCEGAYITEKSGREKEFTSPDENNSVIVNIKKTVRVPLRI